MSCKFNNFQGICDLFGDGIERSGYDGEGICICDDDEEPLDSCEDYEER